MKHFYTIKYQKISFKNFISYLLEHKMEMGDTMNFESKQLYPKPKVEQKNVEYAKLLLQNYAGNTSEDTAIHLYLFQSFILSKVDAKIANDLFQISIVEMHHLKLLGKTIELLGISPEFITLHSHPESKVYWTSENVKYKTSLNEILEINIENESKAIKTYQEHYRMIEDKYVKELLLRIIEDEKIHLEYFQKQLLLLQS